MWKTVRIERERTVEMDADHLPMARRRVLARRCQRAAAERALGHGSRRDAGQRFDIAESERSQIRQRQPTNARDVAERVRVRRISECRSVRHGANTNTIEDNPDRARVH